MTTTPAAIVVLNGCDERCTSQLGALKHAETVGLVGANLHAVVGTSMGAVLATLYAAGYKATELLYALSKEYEDGGTLHEPEVVDLSLRFREAALSSWASMEALLRKLLKARGVPEDTTLQQFVEKVNTRLYLMTYNLTQHRADIMGPETHPTMSVLQAVRMSAAEPFTYPAVEWNGCTHVSGGVVGDAALAWAAQRFHGLRILTFRIQGRVSNPTKAPADTHVLDAMKHTIMYGQALIRSLSMTGTDHHTTLPAGRKHIQECVLADGTEEKEDDCLAWPASAGQLLYHYNWGAQCMQPDS